MAKIKINNDIIDLGMYCRISINMTCIIFWCSETGGAFKKYSKGTDLANADFDTLSAWLLNTTNNPYTIVI